MNNRFHIKPIGTVYVVETQFQIQIDPAYLPALAQLKGFSHLQVLWWAHLADTPQSRETLVAEKLFKKGPDRLGIFATRAPTRPNPIMSSTIRATAIDPEQGLIQTPFIDASDGTPVLDLKPYFPMERVRDLQVPRWCRHWPAWQEEVQAFDWTQEITMR
jgi:tRNA (Thr-GGU) A37 N-methylase